MLKLVITFTIIGSVFSLNSVDLCYSNKDYSECRENYGYQCGKDMCSLNKEICNKYNRYSHSFAFRSFMPLIQFHKEIKRCDYYYYLNETISDLNNKNYCLNRNDCLESYKLIANGITFRNELKKIDCKCDSDFKYKCNRNYCAKDVDSCKMIQKLKNIMKIKNCKNRKLRSVIQYKRI